MEKVLSFVIFFQQFWPFKKPIARMQVASTLRNNNGERESISLLQILRKMVCGTLLVVFVYKDLHDLLLTDQAIRSETDNQRYVNSRIIAVTMDPKPETLRENVILKFKNLKIKSIFRFRQQRSAVCFGVASAKVFIAKINIFPCVLMLLLLFPLSNSLFFNYFFIRDVRQPLSQIRLSVSMSLGAGQIIFIAGINATENKAACVTIAALMQYFLMAAFCWMLIEAIYLYFFVVKVYNINTKMHMYHVISWGEFMILQHALVAVTMDAFGSPNLVLSSIELNILILVRVIKEIPNLVQPIAEDNHFQQIRLGIKACLVIIPLLGVTWLFGLLSPVHKAFAYIFTILNSTQLNIMILARVIKEMTNLLQPIGEDDHSQQIRIGIKSCVVMIPLLGITWIFGLLSPVHKAFVYIFTILSSAQGFLIFVLHCMRNTQIRERLKRKKNIVFPSSIEKKSTRKSSQVNPSEVGDVWAVELQSCTEFQSNSHLT
ncbi:hypothetical protein pdam_00024388 [Pocillopora damicornis]|uniref:G-protein coupled receptors family 2 profile 2 domain-containing protein n=1 Tax=Pocillopora damicornis TaxID=46731 RepID=A0A3M6UIL7_POCDA|nr:hypothetical protein pdam_00024388 [Pocillopora damicornis]